MYLVFEEQDKSLNYWQRRAYQSAFLGIWIAIFFYFVMLSKPVWGIFTSMFLAVLLYYLFSAPVSFLARYLKSRVFAVVIIVLSVFFIIAMLGVYIAPQIIIQAKQFGTIIPYLLGELQKTIIIINGYLASYHIEIPVHYFNEDEFSNSVLPVLSKFKITDVGASIGGFIVGGMATLLYSLLTFIVTFYLLVDGQRAWDIIILPFNKRFQMHLNAIRARVNSSLHAYILGQFQIASMTASVMFITYAALGSSYAVLLGVFQMLEIVPMIGTWVAIVPSLAVIAYTSGSTKFLIALGVYLFYTQIVRDNFVAPRVMGDALGFHPLGIVIAFAVGANLAGAVGVILALPIMAVIAAIIGHFIEMSKLKSR